MVLSSESKPVKLRAMVLMVKVEDAFIKRNKLWPSENYELAQMLCVTLTFRQECQRDLTKLTVFFLCRHKQACCLSPVRPSLTPFQQKSTTKFSPFRKTDDDVSDCVVGKDGEERMNVKALVTNRAQTTASRRPPYASPSDRSPQRNRSHNDTRASVNAGYQRPTVASRSRALSPYTHRKMCQLSEDTRQRLSHLQLGPHHFRKETESQSPFLV